LWFFISEEQTKENDKNVGYLFLSGLQNFVGGRRNDKSGLLRQLTLGVVLK
jgi:hypothetical protein